MTKIFTTVSGLQNQLKKNVEDSIKNRLVDVVMNVVRDQLVDRVYNAYQPQGEYAYDRTYELLDAVSVGKIDFGANSSKFEIFMDSDKINANITGNGEWNQHASHPDDMSMDVSEYIPLWIEEGTHGSLWDRDGAHYMEQSFIELSGGGKSLAKVLADSLRREGWKVTEVSWVAT